VQEALERNVVSSGLIMFGNHMLLVTRMLESGDAPEAEVARSWQSVLPFMLSLSPCH
jgi:hypothetical protein